MSKSVIPLALKIVVMSAIALLFFTSSLRHLLLQTGALDLALFDQWVYLLSQNLPPLSSFYGFHVLGDHAAFILYPIALLYRLWADIHWLLFIQAIALAGGALPLYCIAQQAGLNVRESQAISLCYLLYPALFNLNFYADFRPETIAVPALFWAIWAATAQKTSQFSIAIALILSCKDTLSLTVIALGIWLIVGQPRRRYGVACLVVGVLWFAFTIGYLVPLLRAGEPGGLGFYDSLGGSLSQVALSLLKNPLILLQRALLRDRVFYYLLLIAPVIWGLHWRTLGAFIPALPMLVLNMLSDYAAQRDLIHHYSLPIFPFIFIWLTHSLKFYRDQQQRPWLTARSLIIWSLIAFFALAKYDYFWTRYLTRVNYLNAAYDAIALVPPAATVLTVSHFTPHLSHRPVIHLLAEARSRPEAWQMYDVILIDQAQPDSALNPEVYNTMIDELKNHAHFQLDYAQKGVFLFRQN